MSARRAKILFVTGAVAAGALVCHLAAAYLVARELPVWLAAAVGALAFPVLPVTWQLIGERRRKARIAGAKTPPKSSLSSADRYVMRAVVIALVVLGPMIAIGRFAVVRAAWTERAWFIPDPTFDPVETQGELLAHVPSDAELVIVVRDDDQAKASKLKAGLAVIAYGDHRLAMIAPADDSEPTADKVKQLNDQRDKIPFVAIDPVDVVELGKDVFAVASERWRAAVGVAGVGPSLALRAAIDSAPADAKVRLAYVPGKPGGGIQRATAWLKQKHTNERITLEARFEATTEAAAVKLVEAAKQLWLDKRSTVPAKCRDEVAKLVDAVKVERVVALVTYRLEIEPAQLMELMMCAMKD